MLRNRSFWIYILFSFFILASAVYFHAFIYLYLVAPLAQFFWAIYRLFASVHQRVYWLLFVGFIVFLGYRIIFSVPQEREDDDMDEPGKPKGREQFWVKTISTAIGNGSESREFLRRQLAQLFLSASGLSAQTKPEAAEQLLLNVQPPLPEKLLSLFNQDGGEQEKSAKSVGFAFTRRLFQSLWWRKARRREAIYKDIAETIQSMEDYLEIDHENGPNRKNLF